MTMPEKAELIFKLAVSLAGKTMTFSQLRDWLNEHDITTNWNLPYIGNRGVASMVSWSWHYIKQTRGDDAADVIKWAFTNRHGGYAFD